MDKSRTDKNPVTLFLGITGVILIAAYVNITPPNTGLSIVGFFGLFIATMALLGSYVFSNKRHVCILAGSTTLYLVLRFIGLRHPLYGLLLLASAIALEYLWKDNS